MTKLDIKTYRPEYFFKLAHWAKTHGRFLPWERGFIYNIGVYISRGWNISEKQERQVQWIVKLAEEAGFTQQESEDSISDTKVKVPDENYSIANFNLSTRTYNALTRSGITSVKKLIHLTKEDLLGIRNFGLMCLSDIRANIPGGYLKGLDRPVELFPKYESPNLLINEATQKQLNTSKAPTDKIAIDVLDLSVRATRALKHASIYNLSQLINCNVNYLLKLPNLGHGTYRLIEKKLNIYLKNRLYQRDWDKYVVKIDDYLNQIVLLTKQLCEPFEREKLLNVLYLPKLIRVNIYHFLGKSPKTLEDLRQLLIINTPQIDTTLSFKQAEQQVGALKSVIHWLNSNIACQSIDDEINRLFFNLDDRQKFIAVNRFKIKDCLTLEEIGNRYAITRERVRQLEEKVKGKLIYIIHRVPFFYSTAAVILLRRMGSRADLDLWIKRLININFLKEKSNANILLAIGKVTNSPMLLLPEKMLDSLEKGVPSYLLSARKSIINRFQKICRNCGAVRITSLVDQGLSEDDVSRILRLEGISEIHPGWWIKTNGENTAIRVAQKVVSYCGLVSPYTMRYALRRRLSRLGYPAPPSEVLVKILLHSGEFYEQNGLINLANILHKKPNLTRPESIFIHLINNVGPVQSFEIIHRTLRQHGLSAGSVIALVRYSPLLRKIAHGLYIMLGSHCDSVDIEQAKSQITRVSPDFSIRPKADGIVEFETNVGAWMIYGGTQDAGPAKCMEGIWSIILNGSKMGELNVKGNFLRGLGKVVEYMNLQPGDRIKIDFNTWTREANISKGEGNEPKKEYY